MSRRIVLEEACEHGLMVHKWHPDPDVRGPCPGGSRTVLEGLPDDMIERGKAILYERRAEFKGRDWWEWSTDDLVTRVLEAALSLGHHE